MTIRVIITVNGGLASGVFASEEIDVDILDYDNMKEETEPEYIERYKKLEQELPQLKSMW